MTHLITINDIAKGIDSSIQLDTVLLDFSKFFGKVPHSKLLQQLDQYEVRGKTISTEGCWSSTSPVISGVPQRHALGTLLFLVAYIIDLPSTLKSISRLFADDWLLLRTIR